MSKSLLFDPCLTCSHPAVRTLAKKISEDVLYALDEKRKRRLKVRDRDNRKAALDAVLANLLYAHVAGLKPALVHIGLRAAKQKTTRYDREGMRWVQPLIECLVEAIGPSMLTLQRSKARRVASAIVVGPDIVAFSQEFALAPSDFTQLHGRETIILSRVRRDYVGGNDYREPIDYADNETTIRCRAELVKINAHIATADLSFVPDGGAPVMTGMRTLRRRFSAPSDVSLLRATVFDFGGRLFGGWWLTLKKDRRSSIRIDGEPIADLDFTSMFLRLAYHTAGAKPPSGDLYALPGLTEAQWRPGIKRVVSAMLFRSTPLTRLPRGAGAMLPRNISGKEVRERILSHHPKLASTFETGIGLRLMFLESQIAVAALVAFAEAGITALPMHDGFMVARSNAKRAQEIMEDAVASVLGDCRLPISMKLVA